MIKIEFDYTMYISSKSKLSRMVFGMCSTSEFYKISGQPLLWITIMVHDKFLPYL